MQFWQNRRVLSCALGLVLACSAAPALGTGQFSIHLDPQVNLAANPQAVAAFGRAVAQWEAVIGNPVRVNLSAEISPVFIPGSSTPAMSGTGIAEVNLDYTFVRNAMALRSAPGRTVLGSLPTTAQVSASVPGTGTFNPGLITVTRANQKALGLVPGALTDTGSDGIILFNADITFDYDSSNGITTGAVDFQTVAAREIGHLLGFISATDDYDMDPFMDSHLTTLDLFRFNPAAKPGTPSAFVTAARELRPGFAAAFYDLENEYGMSTGVVGGDESPAGSWKDDAITATRIGLMDPTLDPGQSWLISAADTRAMELIGWDVNVPEPTTGLILAGMVVVVGARRKRV